MSTRKVYPNIRICCPCSSDSPTPGPDPPPKPSDEDDEEDDRPFDPRAPRAAFSLYPLDHLLYCEDCNQVRCPRCVHDEIVCYFCPHCLFEVPSSTVKSEGNRCTRNCFYCPICSAVMSVTATGDADPKTGAPVGPYILLCNHCQWSTREIGVEFDKPTSITAQLAQKLRLATLTSSANSPMLSPLVPSSTALSTSPSSYFPGTGETPPPGPPANDEEAFLRLKTHYSLLKAAASADDYGSGGSLSRLMGMYSNLGVSGRIRSYGGMALSKTSSKGSKDPWTEWEHVRSIDDDESEAAALATLQSGGFEATTTLAQRIAQPHDPRLLNELRPLAALLRTKRSKRCRTCRHILVKPESKVSSIRYRIKLVALNYIPALSFSRRDPAKFDYHNLVPGSTHQFLLCVTNPLFDPISITLASPLKTTGKYPSTVTILCPEFDIGANTDVWEEALSSPSTEKPEHPSRHHGKKSGLPGQIWDAGRNWTTVCIEIIPPVNIPDSATGEDRVVKVPVLVRAVYETDIESEDVLAGTAPRGAKEGGAGREKREHSYWSVIEVGTIGAKPDPPLVEPRPVSMMVGRASPVDVALGKGKRFSIR